MILDLQLRQCGKKPPFRCKAVFLFVFLKLFVSLNFQILLWPRLSRIFSSNLADPLRSKPCTTAHCLCRRRVKSKTERIRTDQINTDSSLSGHVEKHEDVTTMEQRNL